MASDLMSAYPVFRQWMEIGDRIVRNLHGFSPLEAIYAADKSLSDPFDRLEQSHPSLFMTQFALAKLLQSQGVKPDALFGVSLGEFVAMSVSGMIPFETALKAVADQPGIFRKTSPAGALIAALAPVSLRAESPLLSELTEVAGTNAERHCVLACLETHAEQVIAELRRLDVAFQKLPVPFAFHSRWIEPARETYLDAVSDLSFETPFWPVWSSCLSKTLKAADGALLWQIVRGPMELRKTFAAIEAGGGARYLDLSPTSSLAAVLRQELTESSPSEIVLLLSPFGGNLKRLEQIFQN